MPGSASSCRLLAPSNRGGSKIGLIVRLKVLVILGHPRRASLCGALADAYVAGAKEAGVELRRLDLGELQFNPNVVAGSPRNQGRSDGRNSNRLVTDETTEARRHVTV